MDTVITPKPSKLTTTVIQQSLYDTLRRDHICVWSANTLHLINSQTESCDLSQINRILNYRSYKFMKLQLLLTPRRLSYREFL